MKGHTYSKRHGNFAFTMPDDGTLGTKTLNATCELSVRRGSVYMNTKQSETPDSRRAQRARKAMIKALGLRDTRYTYPAKRLGGRSGLAPQ